MPHAKLVFVLRNRGGKVIGLLMKDQRDDAIIRLSPLSAGFVDEYAEFVFYDMLQKEKCRGTPPATW